MLIGLGLLGVSAEAETVLRARLNSDILSTEPGDRRDDITDIIVLHVVEGLVAPRNDGSIAPMLAKSWDVSTDGKTYRFALRTDVTFHNGAPMTSAEVVWSLQRYLRAGSRWRCRLDFSDKGIGKIVSIEAPDAHTVVVGFDRPAPMFLKTLTKLDCGGTGILHPDSVAADGSWKAPIGTGPFMLGEWRHNQSIELLRFPGYAPLSTPEDGDAGEKKVLVDKVRFLVIPDDSSAAAALLRGSVDIVDNISPMQIGSLRDKAGIKLDISPIMDNTQLLFQTRDPVIGDVRLRRAIALSIDTVGLTRAVTFGVSVPNSSPVPTTSAFYGPVEAAPRKRDLAEAKRLVKESGYDGRPIGLITNRRYPINFNTAVLVQAMAQEAGINLQIETLDWATQFDRYTTGNYQLMSFGFSPRLDPSFTFATLIGNKADEPRKTWDTPEARALLQRSMETDDTAQRQAIFDELHRAFLADVPAVYFFNNSRITALRDNVVGFHGWPGGHQRLWGVSVN